MQGWLAGEVARGKGEGAALLADDVVKAYVTGARGLMVTTFAVASLPEAITKLTQLRMLDVSERQVSK